MAVCELGSSLSSEDWLVSRARSCMKVDPYQAKSWLITARTLFPRNFAIQYETYTMAKSQKNCKEAAKLLEEMFSLFPQESQLWVEVQSLSTALQSSATDENTAFLQGVFAALPGALQCRLLQRILDASADLLQQARLALLMLPRYPGRAADQGVKLMDALLHEEKHSHQTSPVNCYRKYMVCDLLPLTLACQATVATLPTKTLLRWLQKTIEFYVCYSTTSITSDSAAPLRGDGSPPLMSPTHKYGGGGRRAPIPGLPDDDAVVDEPWRRLHDTVLLLAQPLAWDMDSLFSSASTESQIGVLSALASALSSGADSSGARQKQLLYCTTVLFFHSLHRYMQAADPALHAGSSSKQPPLVLVEGVPASCERPPSVKTPTIVASDSAPHAKQMVDDFNHALQCWDLLNCTDGTRKEFAKLCQHWKTDTWSWLRQFETDLLLYKAHFKEAISELSKQVLATSPSQSTAAALAPFALRTSLQLASCYYATRSYSRMVELLLGVISSLPSGSAWRLPEAVGGARSLCLLACHESELIPYCLHLLITAFRDIALADPANNLAMGHMIVLLQYDWPRYAALFTIAVAAIRRAGSFVYPNFFNYIICIDVLEEFAFLRQAEGGVTLDILPVSQAALAQQRTMTRGVRQGVHDDFRRELERQVAKSDESVEDVVREFLKNEPTLILQCLV